MINREKVKKILIIQLRAIGDVVLTTAAVHVLKQHFPEAEIHFLTAPGLDSLLKGLPELEKVLVYPYSSKNLMGVFRMLPQIRSEKYDVVIDYQGTPGTAYLTRLSGATYRLGWKLSRRQWAYNLLSNANQNREYVVIQKCQALRQIGVHAETTRIRITFTRQDMERVQSYFNSLKIDQKRLLVNITPKGKRQARTWPAEKIARLADLLIENHHAIVFFNSSPEELEYAQRTANLAKNHIEILPMWPLSTFAAYLSQIDLHFSYDNGPKHMAIAVGTPTVCLFATDPPELWNPLNDPNHRFIVADVPCRFCGLRNCNLMICMEQIEPETVLSEIEKVPAIKAKLKNVSL